jgi:hypothetical protein
MRRKRSDVAMRSLLSEIDNLDAKKKRLGIAQGCQYAREMAEYYEVFDTMKRDMLKQSLIIASITEQQCEAHLQLMRDHRRAEEQFQSTQPPPVNQHTEWATVATEAIRTIGELGKTMLTTQATKQIVKQRAAAAMEPRADEARRATDDEKTAKLATVEQTSITVATVQAIDVPTSPAHAAAIGPIAVLDVLTAKLDRLFGGAGGQPPASQPVAEQTVRATDTDTATMVATASITANVTPSATLEVTPNVTPDLTLNVTPNRQQFEARIDTSVESSSIAKTDDTPFANAMEVPSEERAAVTPTAMMAEAIVTPNGTTSVTPSVTPTLDQNEREADGGNEGQHSAKASESPESTAAPAMRQAAEPQTETAQPDARKSAALTLSQNPYVKSWRSIKSFVRRMTDMDLIVFTSSIPMFRSFLAMLRALTPYYQGPSMSLDELNELAAAPS